MKQLPYLAIIILISLFTGCTPQVQQNTISQDIDWQSETPASITARIKNSSEQIEILSAFFSLNMDPPPANMMSSMSGIFTIDNRTNKPKVRIRAFHLFGSTLFDMVSTDITKIYVPRKNTVYIGMEQSEQGQAKGPQTIFSNMMLDPSDLIIDEDQPFQITDEFITIYLKEGWMKIDKKSGLITSRHKEDLDITYNDYNLFNDATYIPTKIIITASDGSFKARCSLSKISIPESLPESYFDLAEYQPAAVKKLHELQN